MTNNKILLETLEQIRNPLFGQRKKVKFGQKKPIDVEYIRKKWGKAIEDRQQEIKNLYEYGKIEDWGECRALMKNDFAFENEAYSLLVKWIENIDWADLKEVRVLYYYIEILSSDDYEYGCRFNGLVLVKYHKQLQNIIRNLIKKQDFKIVSTFNGGTFRDLIETLIELYFYHTKHSWNTTEDVSQYDQDRQEMAELIPEFIKAFLKDCSGLVLSTLKYHSRPVEAYADLIQFLMRNHTPTEDYFHLASELFSMYNEHDDFFYKKAPDITKIIVDDTDFSDKEVDFLIEEMLLSQLRLSKESQVKKSSLHIKNLENAGFGEDAKKYRDEQFELIENWDSIYAKNWNKALRRVAVSRSISKSIEIIIKAFPTHSKITILKKLMADAKIFKDKPKLYNLNTKPKTVFKDFHFKLLVIEELMYNQKVLRPAFYLEKFVKEYTKKEIETYTCEVIPEVKKFFKNIDIPNDLLEKVTSLYQDRGLSGGSKFIYEMFPDWDPGAGDEVFKVTNKAIDDLELLPNLKKIIGLEASNPSKKLIKTFENKGIILETEEK